MKPKTLLQAATDIVELGCNRNPTFNRLTTIQREQLTAAAMRDAGKYADEYIVEGGFLEALTGTLINALETKNLEHRKELLIKLGEILIDSATEYAQTSADEALDSAITELAVMRQFHDAGEYKRRNDSVFYNQSEI